MTDNAFIFGTVGSPKSTPKKPGGSVGAVHRLAEMGLFALELGWVQSVRVSPETCGAIQEAAREKQVLISVHAPYFINLNADAEEWPKSRQRLMDAAYYGNLAGATDIVFHPGSYFGNSPAETLPVAIERLRGCVDELRAAGNPVILRPETMGKQAMLGSLEDTLVLSREIQGVEPCLDFAHLHARPGDGIDEHVRGVAPGAGEIRTSPGTACAREDSCPFVRDRILGEGGTKSRPCRRRRPGFRSALPSSARLRL